MTPTREELIERLEGELSEMASACSVQMELWDRFSNRVLRAISLLRSDSQRIAELEGEAERLKEAGARAVYDQWSEDPEFVPWVPGGNSLKQDEARRRFRKAFETLPNLCESRALELALADYMRAMREEVIPAINEDLRLQSLMAARLRLGLPVDHSLSGRPGHTAEGTETRDEQIDPALQTQGADNAAKS